MANNLMAESQSIKSDRGGSCGKISKQWKWFMKRNIFFRLPRTFLPSRDSREIDFESHDTINNTSRINIKSWTNIKSWKYFYRYFDISV